MKAIIQKPKPLYEQVYEMIRESILNGDTLLEERINEVHIADQLNVSRGPVRESIRMLEQEGLLVRGERNQLFVYKPTVSDLIDIYECREMLESLAARLAAELMTEKEKEAFSEVVERMKQLITSDEVNLEAIIKANSDFHDFIVEKSRNLRLKAQLRQLRSLTHFYRSYNVVRGERLSQMLEDHLGIYEAILAGESKKASALMSEHIQCDLAHLKTVFGEE
ncbi:GntR family transcriptional regulator [Mesobacillus harenae]|uniref:GntR family transcriptional regulator n=1 Tax=Mesobacillus harenae TaxID=2213203 RepID=UPI0015804B84|nr:GntR family transcriptional regulator [Mesobacillus harenae]